MRTIDELIESGLAVIDSAYHAGAYIMRPLFSGGHDSMCACHLASQHHRFTRDVHHIDTGIGARYTREFVERVCKKQGWNLNVYKSPKFTYERFVFRLGFPGPGAHRWSYNWLKDKCVDQMTRGSRAWTNATMLLTGCRSQESVRRMGHVEPVKIGEWSEKRCKACKKAKRRKGECPYRMCKMVRVKLNRVWTAPCHDWSKAEQQFYMDEMGLPVNKLKVALGLSGECFCGAFASPGELEALREHAPEVAAEIDRLTEIAKANGTPCTWGRNRLRGEAVAETGPLCSSCDIRAAANGLVIIKS